MGPGVALVPCCCGAGCATLTFATMPGVATGAAEAIAIGNGLTAMAVGCGCGRGVCGTCVATAFGLGEGAALGGTFIDTATVAAGMLVGTCAGIGAGETAITACVGFGLGASELTGTGVGLGGAVGANFESSWTTRGCGGAERGRDAITGLGTTGACGAGGETFATCTGALEGTGRVLTVMMIAPATDSGACADDEVATENTKSAMSA